MGGVCGFRRDPWPMEMFEYSTEETEFWTCKCLQGVPERARVRRSLGDLDISNNAGSAVLRRRVHSATVARSPVLSV